jgi:hypothetical protein
MLLILLGLLALPSRFLGRLRWLGVFLWLASRDYRARAMGVLKSWTTFLSGHQKA